MRTDALAAALARLTDRLRHLPEDRLARPPRGPAAPGVSPGDDGATVADLAHSLAQRLADTARGFEGRELARPPDPRAVPRLGDLSSADLVAVTGGDVLRAAGQVRGEEAVWAGGVRCRATDAVDRAAAAVADLNARV